MSFLVADLTSRNLFRQRIILYQVLKKKVSIFCGLDSSLPFKYLKYMAGCINEYVHILYSVDNSFHSKVLVSTVESRCGCIYLSWSASDLHFMTSVYYTKDLVNVYVLHFVTAVTQWPYRQIVDKEGILQHRMHDYFVLTVKYLISLQPVGLQDDFSSRKMHVLNSSLFQDTFQMMYSRSLLHKSSRSCQDYLSLLSLVIAASAT